MANRYWVGGDGTFSDTAHWSLESGGAGGASAPVTGDWVYFDANSKPGSAVLDLAITTSTSCYFIINDVKLNVTLTSSWYLYGTITGLHGLTINSGGKFYNEDYDVYISNFLEATGNGELWLNAFLQIGGTYWTSGNTYFSLGSSSGGAIRYSEIEFNARSTGSYIYNHSASNNCYFWKLKINLNGCTAAYDSTKSFTGAEGYLSLTGYDGTLDITGSFGMSTAGMSVNLQGATSGGLILTGDAEWILTKGSGSVTALNCTIVNGNAYGGATFLARTSKGNVDGGGNTGWIFTAYNRYWVGNGGSWSNTAHWSETSGGAGGASVPNYTDGVCFDANSITSSGQTITLDLCYESPDFYIYPALDFTNVLNSPTFKYPRATSPATLGWLIVFGDFKLKSGMAVSYTHADGCNLLIAADGTLNFAGNALKGELLLLNTVADVTFASDVTCRSLYPWSITGTYSYSMNVNFGNYTITLSPQGADVILAWENPTRWTGTPNLVYSVSGFSGSCNFTGSSFIGSMGNITFTGTPTAIEVYFSLSQSLTVGTLTLPPHCASWAVYFDSGNNVQSPVMTVGDLIANGSAINQLSIHPYSVDTYPIILSKASGVISLTYCTLADMHATGGATFLARTSNGCVDGGGNTGWDFIPIIATPSGGHSLSGSGINIIAARKASLTSGALALSGTAITGKVVHKLSIAPVALAKIGSTIAFQSTHYTPASSSAANIFNDFEFGDFVNLDTLMWGGGDGAGGYTIQADNGVLSKAGTGINLKTSRTLDVANGSLAEAGTGVTLQKDVPLEISPGSFASEGAAVAFKITRVLPISSGAITEAGQIVGVLADRKLGISSGEITETGDAVGFAIAKGIAATSAELNLSGSAVEIISSRKISAGEGSLSEDGQAINLFNSRLIQTLFGAEIVSGSDVGLKRIAKLLIDAAIVETVGQSIDLAATRKLVAEAGTVESSGSDIDIKTARKINAENAGLVLEGPDITYNKGNTLEALFGASVVSGSDIGFKRFLRLIADAGAITIAGADIDLAHRGIGINPRAFTLSGSVMSFGISRTVYVETVYSSKPGRSVSSTERVNRVTAGQRITGA